jgi:integrase
MSRSYKLKGSIYKHTNSNTLYIKLGGKNFSTGVKDTEEGWKVAEQILKELNNTPEKIINPGGRPLQLYYNDFLRFKKSRCNEKTLRGYRLSYRTVVGANGSLPYQPNCLKDIILEYLETATKEGFSPHTTNNYLTGFRVFLNWIADEHSLPRFNVKKYFVKARLKVVDVYTIEEINLLREFLEQRNKHFRQLIDFLLLTGFRISEALLLRWEDVRKDYILVISKDKQREDRFPISEALQKLLTELRELNNRKVFYWVEGSASRLNRTLIEAFKEIGIARNGRAFHTFRKTFSTMLFHNNLELTDVKDLMRHKSIQTTLNHYKETNINRLKDKLNNLTSF